MSLVLVLGGWLVGFGQDFHLRTDISPQATQWPRSLQSAMVGDFDGNGLPDFAWATSSGLIAVYNPLGSTLPPPAVAVTPYVFPLVPDQGAVADFDGDGITDLLLENSYSWTVSARQVTLHLFRGSPQGLLPPRNPVNLGVGEPRGMRTGDFNGDGRLDFLIQFSSPQGAPFRVDTWIQQPGRTFQLASSVPIFGSNPPGFRVAGSLIEVADFNGDGFDDWVVIGKPFFDILEPVDFMLYLGNPSAAWNPIIIATGLSSLVVKRGVAIAVEDLDGDQRPDLALLSSAALNIFVMWQFPREETLIVFRGDPVVGLRADPVQVIRPGVQVGFGHNHAVSAAIGDLDGDQRKDLIYQSDVGSGTSSLKLFAFRGDDQGGFSLAGLELRQVMFASFPKFVDLDDDVDVELVYNDDVYDNLALFGQVCSGSLGVPRFEIGVANPGNPNFVVQLEGALPNAPQELIISGGPPVLSRATSNCSILIQPDLIGIPLGLPWFMSTTDANGAASRSFQLPPVVSGPFLLQWAILDPLGAFVSPTGERLSLTAGRTLRIF